jgi:hypothetical protein
MINHKLNYHTKSSYAEGSDTEKAHQRKSTILTELVTLFYLRNGRNVGVPTIVQRCLLLPRGFLGVNRYDCFDHVYLGLPTYCVVATQQHA